MLYSWGDFKMSDFKIAILDLPISKRALCSTDFWNLAYNVFKQREITFYHHVKTCSVSTSLLKNPAFSRLTNPCRLLLKQRVKCTFASWSNEYGSSTLWKILITDCFTSSILLSSIFAQLINALYNSGCVDPKCRYT
jgi:hypothetical protein